MRRVTAFRCGALSAALCWSPPAFSQTIDIGLVAPMTGAGRSAR